MSVGFSGFVALRVWGKTLYEVFGEMPYQVGSSTNSKEFRDVDVVVLLSPEKFYSWTGPHGIYGIRWQAICASFSAWGKEITGLPIDFKIQPVDWANTNHTGPREALGINLDKDWIHPDCPLKEEQYKFPTTHEHLINKS